MISSPIRCATSCALAFVLTSSVAHAQVAPVAPVAPGPEASNRSGGWNSATNVMAASSLLLVTVMPRVFFSDPEVTAGWKARFHVSALAPAMTIATLALFNDQVLKGSFEGARPGCEGAQGQPGCSSYGFLSTPSFVAGSALGQGAGVFLVDTMKWNHGSINAGALVGDVIVPLILAPLTTIGRTSGNWETGGQAWGSAAIGLGVGLGMGLLYASMQRPECGYTGNLICW